MKEIRSNDRKVYMVLEDTSGPEGTNLRRFTLADSVQ